MFVTLITYGFRKSSYCMANRNCQFSFFAGQNNVHANSMLSLERVGLVDGSFVYVVEQIPVTINFRLRSVSFYLSDFIYSFIDAADHLLALHLRSRHDVCHFD
jgi:hypothetical protein